MDSLEHRVTLADVCAAGCADAALELGSLVGDDVAVEVREDEDFEVAAALLVDELRRGDVDVPLVGHDVGIFLADLFAEVEKLAVRGLDDICLCDYRNAALVVAARVVICESCDSVAALGGRHDEVEREVVGNIDSHRADGICALGVLAEEGPVDTLFGNLDRTDVCEKIKLFAHRNVRTFDVGPFVTLAWGGCGSLEDDVAGFKLGQHIVGNGLHNLCAVLDGQTVYFLELDLSGLHIVCKEELKHSFGFLGDDRTDSVAAANADYKLIKRVIVDKVLFGLHSFDALELFTDYRLKFFGGLFYHCFIHNFHPYICDNSCAAPFGGIQHLFVLFICTF